MGWWSDVKEWTAEKAENISDTVVDGAKSVAHAVTHPVETYDKAVDATSNAMTATVDYFEERGALGFVEDVGRSIEVTGQGLVKGIGSGGAVLGDLAVNVGYNWTTRHAINVFRDEDLESYNSNYAGRAAEALTWTEPSNDYERALMSGGQVVGEIGSFIAVTVATAGVGGAVVGGSMAVARGGSLAAAGVQAMNTARTVGTATTAFMNPAASSIAAGTEGAFGAMRFNDLASIDANAQDIADDVQAQAVDNIAQIIATEQRDLQETANALKSEVADIKLRLSDANTSAEEREALYDRVDEIKEAHNIMTELRSNIDDERRIELHQRLDEIHPYTPEQANLEDNYGAEIYSTPEDELSLNAMVSQQGDQNIAQSEPKEQERDFTRDQNALPTVG